MTTITTTASETATGICNHCGNIGVVGEECAACIPQDGLGPMRFHAAATVTTATTTTFAVFVRNWWKMEGGSRVPDSRARKTYLERGLTFSEAQRCAQEYNRTHSAGKLSRKAEFEEARRGRGGRRR